MVPIILIVGAPAVGKTAVAQALAERFVKSVHVAVDSLRDMVVYRSLNQNIGSLRTQGWIYIDNSTCPLMLLPTAF